MSESKTHKEFVDLICNYVIREFPFIENAFMRIDKGDVDLKPGSTTEGFIPDFEYEYNGVLIIGEAKTEEDLERKHSLSQYQSFLERCERYDGRSVFILSAPWGVEATAKNTINRIMRKHATKKTEIKILNELAFLSDQNAENKIKI